MHLTFLIFKNKNNETLGGSKTISIDRDWLQQLYVCNHIVMQQDVGVPSEDPIHQRVLEIIITKNLTTSMKNKMHSWIYRELL